MLWLAFLVLAAAPMPDIDGPCGGAESDWPSDERLMPEEEVFKAEVLFLWSQEPGASCPAPQCADLMGRVHFGVDEKPHYATVRFEPTYATPRYDIEREAHVANTTVFINTTMDAPAFEDGRYGLYATGCGWTTVNGAFTLKNDYRSNVSASPQEPAVWDPEGTEPVAVPTPAFLVSLGLIAVAAFLTKRA